MKYHSLCRHALLVFAGILLVQTASAHPQGYGSYENYNHGPAYNIVPVQPAVPVVAKVVDYYAKPKYSFGYEVEDYYNQLSHGRWEVRDGDVVQGQYRVLLPDGRIQIVSYIADKAGYRPHIQYIGKGVHPPPPPAYAHVKVPAALLAQPVPVVEPALPVAGQPEVVGYSPEYGHQYGGDYGYGYGYNDHVLSPSTIAQKRALLYDRTLFRRDLAKPKTSSKKAVKRSE